MAGDPAGRPLDGWPAGEHLVPARRPGAREVDVGGGPRRVGRERVGRGPAAGRQPAPRTGRSASSASGPGGPQPCRARAAGAPSRARHPRLRPLPALATSERKRHTSPASCATPCASRAERHETSAPASGAATTSVWPTGHPRAACGWGRGACGGERAPRRRATREAQLRSPWPRGGRGGRVVAAHVAKELHSATFGMKSQSMAELSMGHQRQIRAPGSRLWGAIIDSSGVRVG